MRATVKVRKSGPRTGTGVLLASLWYMARPVTQIGTALLRVVFMGLLFPAMGCGGLTSGGAGGPAPPVSEADFRNALAHALCDNIAGCCQKAGYVYDDAECVSLQLMGIGLPKHAKFSAQQAGVCVQDTANLARSCDRSKLPLDELAPSCNSVFTGTQPPGAACQTSLDCAEPSNGTAFCYAGLCVAVTRATAGAPCVQFCNDNGNFNSRGLGCFDKNGVAKSGGAACFISDGLYCSSQSRCARLPGVGQSCAVDSGCKPGAYCSGGVCRDAVAIGGDCSLDQCVAGATCDFQTRTCKPLPLVTDITCDGNGGVVDAGA